MQSSEELLAHLAELSADIPTADMPGQLSQMQRQNELDDLEVIQICINQLETSVSTHMWLFFTFDSFNIQPFGMENRDSIHQ